jgi:hypothetical protein
MRNRTGELLVQSGAIGARRLEEAYRRQVVYGGSLDTVLLEMNAVEEPRLRAALAAASGLEVAPEESLQAAQSDPQLATYAQMCARLRVVPLGIEDGALRVIVCELSDPRAASELSGASGLPVRAWIAPEYRVAFELERLCGAPMSPRMAALARRRIGPIVRELFAKKHVRDSRADESHDKGDKVVPAELADWGESELPPEPKPFVRDDTTPPITRQEAPPRLELLPAWDKLAKAQQRDDIFDALCELACARLDFAAVLTLHGTTAVLGVARNLEGPVTGRELKVELDDCGSFRAAVESQSAYVGAVDDASRSALLDLGRRVDQVVFVPILVAGRVVALLYGDHGARPVRSGDVTDVATAVAAAGQAFHELILRNKRGTFEAAPESEEGKLRSEAPEVAPQYAPFYSPESAEPVAKVPSDREIEGDLASIEKVREIEAELPEVPRMVAEAPPLPADEPPAPSRSVPEAPPLPAEAVADPDPEEELAKPQVTPTVIIAEIPEISNDLPPVAGSTESRIDAHASPAARGPSVIVAPDDPDGLAQMVATGSYDEADRASESLLGLGSSGLDALLRRFPGPLRVDRRSARGGDLMPVLEHGPILRAVARFGRRAVPPLLRLLGHGSADVRFYSTYLMTELAFPEALALVGLRLYDADSQVRQVALEVVRKFETGMGADVGGREFREVLERLRGDLVEPDAERARLAAVACGELRDPKAVPRLIELLKHREPRVADAAHRALVVITKQDFDRSRWRWRAWWDKNRSRHRVEWMLEGLAHKAPEVRLSASEELKRLTSEYFGYHFDLPKREREEARRKWIAWWEQVGRKRFAQTSANQ